MKRTVTYDVNVSVSELDTYSPHHLLFFHGKPLNTTIGSFSYQSHYLVHYYEQIKSR